MCLWPHDAPNSRGGGADTKYCALPRERGTRLQRVPVSRAEWEQAVKAQKWNWDLGQPGAIQYKLEIVAVQGSQRGWRRARHGYLSRYFPEHETDILLLLVQFLLLFLPCSVPAHRACFGVWPARCHFYNWIGPDATSAERGSRGSLEG
jgi:hypothetical protein